MTNLPSRITDPNALRAYFAVFLIAQLSLSAAAQIQFLEKADPNNNVISDTLFLELGTLRNGRFEVVDVRSRTALGFYRKKSKNTFVADTVFSPISKADYFFQHVLDSFGHRYTTVENLSSFLDSVRQRIKRKDWLRVRFVSKSEHGCKECFVVFARIKATIIYNNSYVKQQGIEDTYEFTATNQLQYSKRSYIVYKPILKWVLLDKPN